jgi:hypothetical protein
MFEIQYFKKSSTKSKNTAMHDLYSIYVKVSKQVKRCLEEYLVDGQNVRFYSHKPKMSDVEVLSLAITAECLGIDSENLLWAKINKDYQEHFPNLIHRTRYNARRKALNEWFIYCAHLWSEQITDQQEEYIVDSIPIPVCRIAREKSSLICRSEKDLVKASKGYSSTDKQYFIGYKLHLIVSSSGVFQECEILPGNVHDINFLKLIEHTHLSKCTLIGDRAYRSAPVQLHLFDQFEIDLSVPFRRNQRDHQEYCELKRIKRKRIETVFSQYCDAFLLKRNYAKTFSGLEARIYSKIAAMTFQQLWNYLNGNKISRTKHSLAA